MLAYDYPLLSVFWTLIIFYLIIAWIMALFHVLGDIFRSPDLSGLSRAVWLLFVIFVPFLGVFVYLIARGGMMAQHAMEHAQAQNARYDSYPQQAGA